MGVSKVTINGEPVMDVTEMTVDEDSLLVGETALRNDGETVTGAVVTAPASDADPLMDGTASSGVSDTYSRGDHVHPTDTSRAAAVHTHTTSEITDFPTNVSEFDNDAGYLTTEVDPVFSASPSAGITSADIAGWDSKAEVADIPTAVSELDNDAGYLSVEADPVFSASPAHGISTTDISNWNAKAEVSDIPTKVSELANDEGYLTTETDPVYSASVAAGITAQNVSSWNAKAEVSDIPTDVSELNNDAGYLTTETDPTVPAWAKAATKPSYTPAEVGAATSDHVHGNITNGGDITVNVAIESGDRLVINDESGSKIANSSITFGTSTDTFLRNDGTWGNPAGGVTSVNSKTGAVVLDAEDVGALPDDTFIPSKVSDLTNDAGYLSAETDPVFSTSPAASVTTAKMNAWDAKAEVSDIPTNVSELTNDSGYLTTETDPTVPAWAKAASKPTYTAQEVGALPSSTFIPSATSDLTNDSDFVSDANYVHTDSNYTAAEKTKLAGIAEGATVDDHKWAGVSLGATGAATAANQYVPVKSSMGNTDGTADWQTVTSSPSSYNIPKYDSNAYLKSTTPTAGDSSTKVATTAFVNAAISNIDALPDQTGQSGKFLTTNGTVASWIDNPSELFWVNITDGQESGSIVADKTVNEIIAAKGSGKLPVINYSGEQYNLNYYEANNNYAQVYFSKNSGAYSDEIHGEFSDNEDYWGIEYKELASINSPTFFGIPTAPTPTSISVATQIATKGYVDNHTPDLSGYMQKGVDYVTAGKKSGTTLGTRATAEGYNTTSSNAYSHAEGNGTQATQEAAHAEGFSAKATAPYSHAEGNGTQATQEAAHAEGYYATAFGQASHAEGDNSIASGYASHAEGNAAASGRYAHAEGVGTVAQRRAQHAFGEYNILDATGEPASRGQYVEIVGNGTSASARSNARTLDWSGNEGLAGKLTVGAGPTNNMDVATKQYVDTAVGSVDALPSQSGQSGKFLTTNGTAASWANVTVPTYTLSISGNRITLTPSSGTASYIDLPVYNGAVS